MLTSKTERFIGLALGDDNLNIHHFMSQKLSIEHRRGQVKCSKSFQPKFSMMRKKCKLHALGVNPLLEYIRFFKVTRNQLRTKIETFLLTLVRVVLK